MPWCIRKSPIWQKFFDVQDKGEALIASLKARESAAKNKITGMDKNVSAVFWFSSADLQLDPYVAGKFGPAAWIAQTLGVKKMSLILLKSGQRWAGKPSLKLTLLSLCSVR
ncbi:ABC transporter (iron.B12.siderophore.hemin), periplasmic substrate-binding component [Citrobacter freundii]|uniref:ABC transporter (Iron.B12.siderophore.hemin), periplasmic substrate-binding component n=1 Tax=Citrobacter freundii TaxID=546 RepID=A0A7G2IGN5_CITFR|nr:ABC transporter (iron.B12.siderophore.hemin), periplasmic substrate-binding component [Citrobacter freundii]